MTSPLIAERNFSAINGSAMDTNEDKEDSKTILDHNWKMVSQRQRDASTRVLQMLERTTNEVTSLQSGLFNVQSITAAQNSLKEAQKGLELNRYLLVFTIVTIVFLPPTFAATFFGMDAFSFDTDQATRRLFWTVFAVLSGVTYALAFLGLFGFHLVPTKRNQLMSRMNSKWDEVVLKLKERRGNRNPARSSEQA
ncbi:uncharacterized protein FTJAE_8354 [Fusarium tjaetaba]|uniref:Uncharacterized protein n=1 Tax=Fusarium tjaetaba TaxID=1567544 RepID=A0A8H5RB56_9HYPO|nr:uncharacterized protein FTJAE_8354 [Fusarium tjaetaba]KAF5629984.1 hypothetical protein FTJAE_8354 [Fusarium tjaetaba]